MKDFFFDDELWRIRYFVFETGGFLSRQQVLIAPLSISIEQVDRENIVRVDLTMDQIRNSPDIDADKPVSRQYEMEIASYYGWPTYWTMEPVGAVPIGTPLADPPATPPGDPHLRSFDELAKYDVVAVDGSVGELVDMLTDDESWRLESVVIKTGDWLKDRKLAVDARKVGEISFGNQTVLLDCEKRELETAPEYEPVA